jgi:hypothetical protein
LWDQFFEKRKPRILTYVDKVSRWNGAGKNEFVKNLNYCTENNLVVRAIIAKSKKPNVISAGGAGSNLGNTFHPKEDWVGKVILWDGDNFEIEFCKQSL